MAISCGALTAYWSLEETGISATRVDAKTGNDLTPTNSVSGVAGTIGTAASFDGTSYLGRASTADLTMDSNVSFSGAFWMFLAGSGTQGLVWKGNTVGVLTDYSWRINTSTNKLLFAVTNSVSQGVLTTTQAWSTSTPTFVAFWYDGANLYCDLNDSGSPNSVAYTAGGWADGNPFALGASGNGGSIISNGSWLDEVSIWRGYAFTAGDVTTLYNGGAGYGYASICPSATLLALHDMRGGMQRGMRGGLVN